MPVIGSSRKYLVALVGGPGSGKTTVADHLVLAGFTFFSISEVRRVAGLCHDIDINNFDSMKAFSDGFYAKKGRGIFTDYALRNIAARNTARVVLEGLRYPESVLVARHVCLERQWPLLVMGLRVSKELATVRIQSRARPRDPQSPTAIAEYANWAGRLSDNALDLCDVVIDNESTVSELREKSYAAVRAFLSPTD
jgi:RecA/RadA recombinase